MPMRPLFVIVGVSTVAFDSLFLFDFEFGFGHSLCPWASSVTRESPSSKIGSHRFIGFGSCWRGG